MNCEISTLPFCTCFCMYPFHQKAGRQSLGFVFSAVFVFFAILSPLGYRLSTISYISIWGRSQGDAAALFGRFPVFLSKRFFDPRLSAFRTWNWDPPRGALCCSAVLSCRCPETGELGCFPSPAVESVSLLDFSLYHCWSLGCSGFVFVGLVPFPQTFSIYFLGGRTRRLNLFSSKVYRRSTLLNFWIFWKSSLKLSESQNTNYLLFFASPNLWSLASNQQSYLPENSKMPFASGTSHRSVCSILSSRWHLPHSSEVLSGDQFAASGPYLNTVYWNGCVLSAPAGIYRYGPRTTCRSTPTPSPANRSAAASWLVDMSLSEILGQKIGYCVSTARADQNRCIQNSSHFLTASYSQSDLRPETCNLFFLVAA